MMLEAIEKFKKNPLVGFGILDDDIYYGGYKKKGSMAWYHMMIPQVVGSMGTGGDRRLRLPIRRQSKVDF